VIKPSSEKLKLLLYWIMIFQQKYLTRIWHSWRVTCFFNFLKKENVGRTCSGEKENCLC